MRHEWTKWVLDGYEADAVDFLARLGAASQAARDELDDLILSPLINSVNEGAVLVVQGHADRVDTGEGHAICLQREMRVSWTRAESATNGILELIRRDWLSPSTTWDDLPYLGVHDVALGAGHHVDDSGSDDGRRKNRRVVVQLCRIVAD